MEIREEVRRTVAKKVAIGVALFIAFAMFIVIGGFVVRWLWNWLVPDLFGVRAVTFWEALGLLLLSRIMFGGFGRSGGSRRSSGHHRREWWRKAAEAPDRDAEAGQPG
ncbi:MAG: hypothetical protein AB1635_04605 [Acidobacteriota bacterium]